MKSIVDQLSTYKSVHLNASNVKTHFVGIPLIIWSVALLLNLMQFNFSLFGEHYTIGLASIIGILACVYYVLLHKPLALLVILIFGPVIYSTHYVLVFDSTLLIAVITFVIGWIFQFIGHGYEKAKPAFIDDLNQLLIGPLFLIAEIYFALGFGKNLAVQVHDKAVEKRRIFEQAKAH